MDEPVATEIMKITGETLITLEIHPKVVGIHRMIEEALAARHKTDSLEEDVYVKIIRAYVEGKVKNPEMLNLLQRLREFQEYRETHRSEYITFEEYFRLR